MDIVAGVLVMFVFTRYGDVMAVTPSRPYYSMRTGKNPAAAQLSFDTFRSLVVGAIRHFEQEGYFDEQFGFECVDSGFVPGAAGRDIVNYALFKLRRRFIWPLVDDGIQLEEHDLFDVVEFLSDHISKPTKGNYHSWNECGMHWLEFDRGTGLQVFMDTLNPLLEAYGSGYELNDAGEILERGPSGLRHLFDAEPASSDAPVLVRLDSAVDRFRRRGASIDDRQKAVRDLADVLEWLRPQIKETLLRKDEQDLFQIANEFGIRHLNKKQKIDYDPAVWLSWMFYYYLATIHACLHLIERQKVKRAS